MEDTVKVKQIKEETEEYAGSFEEIYINEALRNTSQNIVKEENGCMSQLRDNDNIQNVHVKIKCEENNDEVISKEMCLVKQEQLQDDLIVAADDDKTEDEGTTDNETMQDCSNRQKTQRQGENCKKASSLNKIQNPRKKYTKKARTGDKSFECEHCHKKFARKDNLKEHLLIHIDENSFECKKCDKKFRHKASLRRHVLMHTTENYTGEKSFECEDCNKKFAQLFDLGQQHFLQHTEIDPKTNRKRKRTCKVCREENKRTCVTTICDQCEGNPGFCIPCFKIFHL